MIASHQKLCCVNARARDLVWCTRVCVVTRLYVFSKSHSHGVRIKCFVHALCVIWVGLYYNANVCYCGSSAARRCECMVVCDVYMCARMTMRLGGLAGVVRISRRVWSASHCCAHILCCVWRIYMLRYFMHKRKSARARIVRAPSLL